MPFSAHLRQTRHSRNHDPRGAYDKHSSKVVPDRMSASGRRSEPLDARLSHQGESWELVPNDHGRRFGKDATSGLVTGGMVTVEMTVPKDTGGASLSNLRYKVEMISKNGPKGTAQALGTNSLASSRILEASACDMSSLNTRRITLNGDGDWNTNDMFVPCIATHTCSTAHSNKNSCSNDEDCCWVCQSFSSV